MSYRLKKYERETIISFNEKETIADVYTCSTQIKNRLKELSLKNSDIYLTNEDKYSQSYTIPKNIIRFSLPRELSEKQKQERALKLHENIEKHKAQQSDKNGVI